MEDKEKRITVGLHMNETPMNVYKKFIKDIDRYNNTYWIKLMDLMTKAEAFDKLLEIKISEDVSKETEKEEEKKPRKTLGGAVY